MITEFGFSRRELFKRAGVAGAAIFAMPDLSRVLTLRRELFAQTRTLTPPEKATLTAMCARIIPTDDNGPGAIEAHAPEYIDHALNGALASSRQAVRCGVSSFREARPPDRARAALAVSGRGTGVFASRRMR